MSSQKPSSLPRLASRDTFGSNGQYHCRHFDRCMIDTDMTLPVFPFMFTDQSTCGNQWCHHHNYPHAAVELILEGSIDYVTESRTFNAGPGDLFFIVPGSCVKIINSKDKSTKRKIVVIIGGNAPGLFCESLGLTSDTLIKTSRHEEFQHMLYEIGRALKRGDAHVKLSQLAYNLMSELADEHKRHSVEISREMTNLKNYLTQNFNQPLTIEHMADFCGFSKSTLIRRFKESFNTTPLNFISLLRMERSKSMLLGTDMPVKEIAFQCGFSTVSHFCVIFRRFYGFSPAVYRRRYKKEKKSAALKSQAAVKVSWI